MQRSIRPFDFKFFGVAVCAAILTITAVSAASAPPAEVSPMSKLEWRSVGPYIGGRVVAIAGVPGQQNLFYMGAVDGGVWKSSNYGISWTNISDGTLPGSSNSIGAIAVAPSDTKILYVGTGESDIRGDVITGDGVFRSDDAGKTWKALGLEDTHTISGLVIDPQNPDIVYASSMGHVFKSNDERGVFKSVDGGKTWSKVLYVDDRYRRHQFGDGPEEFPSAVRGHVAGVSHPLETGGRRSRQRSI